MHFDEILPTAPRNIRKQRHKDALMQDNVKLKALYTNSREVLD